MQVCVLPAVCIKFWGVRQRSRLTERVDVILDGRIANGRDVHGDVEVDVINVA